MFTHHIIFKCVSRLFALLQFTYELGDNISNRFQLACDLVKEILLVAQLLLQLVGDDQCRTQPELEVD